MSAANHHTHPAAEPIPVVIEGRPPMSPTLATVLLDAVRRVLAEQARADEGAGA